MNRQKDFCLVCSKEVKTYGILCCKCNIWHDMKCLNLKSNEILVKCCNVYFYNSCYHLLMKITRVKIQNINLMNMK